MGFLNDHINSYRFFTAQAGLGFVPPVKQAQRYLEDPVLKMVTGVFHAAKHIQLKYDQVLGSAEAAIPDMRWRMCLAGEPRSGAIWCNYFMPRPLPEPVFCVAESCEDFNMHRFPRFEYASIFCAILDKTFIHRPLRRVCGGCDLP